MRLATGLLLIALGVSPPASARPDAFGQDDNRPPPPEQRDGRGPDRDGRGPEDRGPDPLTAEQVPDAIAVILELHDEDRPGWLKDIIDEAEKDPEDAARRLSRFPHIVELIDARNNRPEEFKLHQQHFRLTREVYSMARDYRRARHDNDPDTMAKLRPRIREKMEQVFDTRVKIREMEIRRLEAQLKEAKDGLEVVIDRREQEIDNQMDWLDRDRGDRGDRGGRNEDDNNRRNRDDDRDNQN